MVSKYLKLLFFTLLFSGALSVGAQTVLLSNCSKLDSLVQKAAGLNPQDTLAIRLAIDISYYSNICNSVSYKSYPPDEAWRRSKNVSIPPMLRVMVLKEYTRRLIIHGQLDLAKLMTDTLELENRKLRSAQIAGNIALRRGIILFRRGSLDSGLRLMHKAESLLVKYGNSTDLFATYCNLGVSSGYMMESEPVMEYYDKAFKVAESLGIKFGMAIVKGNMAEIRINQKKYNEALKLERDTYKYFRSFGIEPPGNFAGLDIAYIHYLKHDYRNAITAADSFRHYLDPVWNIKSQRTYHMGQHYTRLGNIYLGAGNKEIALQMGLKALETLRGLDDANDLANLYMFLSKAYQSLGDTRKAMYCRDTSYRLRDNVKFNFQLKKILDSEEKIRNLEKKEELAGLSKEVKIMQLQAESTRFYRICFIVMSLLFLGVIIMIYRLYVRSKMMSDRLRKQVKAENERLATINELNRTKDSFYSILVHDLRAPIVNLQALPKLYEHSLNNNDNDGVNQLNKKFADVVDGMLTKLDDLNKVETGHNAAGEVIEDEE
ncbi:MAG: hypothetical protein V4543_13620 [Bacteroidota bacterium]